MEGERPWGLRTLKSCFGVEVGDAFLIMGERRLMGREPSISLSELSENPSDAPVKY